jgi:hypothetical protein|nr:MAG TPA: hypothetical protein [Caudoviricetes sp.]
MKQFKFGDMVHYETDSKEVFGFVIRKDYTDDLVIVQFNNKEYPAAVKGDKLKFIPHPDSAYLHFLAAECDITIDELRKALDEKKELYYGNRMVSEMEVTAYKQKDA